MSRSRRGRGGSGPRLRHRIERVALPSDGPLRVAILADSHGHPHPELEAHLVRDEPHLILHAGDVGGRTGGLDLLDRLAGIAPTIAVRGNVDSRDLGLYDVITVELASGGEVRLRMLLLHVGVARTRLQAGVRDLARLRDADLVICGHSHVPFLGEDDAIVLFNPGSCGPRRFHLPITYGRMTVDTGGVRLSHVDCETGEPWFPRGPGEQRG